MSGRYRRACPLPNTAQSRSTAAARRTIRVVAWSEWVRTVEIEPSLYAADFARLGEEVGVLLNAGAKVFHFDVGDGHFVEPVTIGPVVLQSIAPMIHERGGVLDCHLMVLRPERQIPLIARAGGDSVTFHVEAVDDVRATAALARKHGLQVGVAFNPGTAVADAARAAEHADLCLCMSIEPGYSGQEFMPEALARIEELRALLPPRVHVQVDGGITDDNVRAAHDAGATLIVAGSSIFHREDLPRAYRRLVQALA
jgi:ribulose-phosphate 3-epimerase